MDWDGGRFVKCFQKEFLPFLWDTRLVVLASDGLMVQ